MLPLHGWEVRSPRSLGEGGIRAPLWWKRWLRGHLSRPLSLAFLWSLLSGCLCQGLGWGSSWPWEWEARWTWALVLWSTFEGVRWGHVCTSMHPEHPQGDTGWFSPFLATAFLNVSGWIRVFEWNPQGGFKHWKSVSGQGPHRMGKEHGRKQKCLC